MYSSPSIKSRHNRPASTSSTLPPATSFYKAPSRNANDNKSQKNRSRYIYDTGSNVDACDETWPLDEVINRIESKTDTISDQEEVPQYDVQTDQWKSGPQIIHNTFNSGRDTKRLPGHGTLYSSFNQGSTTWKDTSVKHRKYKTKSPKQSQTSGSLGGSAYDLKTTTTTTTTDSKHFLPYDANNNYLDIDISYDLDLDDHKQHPGKSDIKIQKAEDDLVIIWMMISHPLFTYAMLVFNVI